VRPAIRLNFRAYKVSLLVLSFALHLGISGQTSNKPLGSITSALQNRDFQKALQLLGPSLQKSPRDPQLWTLQGLAYSGESNSKSALASYRHAITISPDYLPALEGAAQIEYEAGGADAIPLLRHILKLRPEDATSHAMLAVLAEKNNDCSTAVENYSASGLLLNSQPEAMQGYALCLFKLGQTDKAIAVFQQLVDAAPENPRWRRGLAAVQLAAAKPQDALATLQPVLNADADVSTMRLAAAAFEAERDTPSAVKILHDAIVKDPRQIALYADFAEISMDHQSFQAGVEMVNAGIKLRPDAAPLYLARGVLYVQLAEYENAEADFEKAEQLDPKMGMSAAAQGMLAEEEDQKDPERALETVRAKLAEHPGDAFLWYLQAAILSERSPDPGSADFKKGLDSAKKAVTLQPSLEAAHNLLAKYYLDSSQYALSAKECRLVLEKTPSDQSALYHLVMALRRAGNQAEIPDLLRRLAKARQDATRQEGERNRYKLVVTPSEPLN
jgi:tetratricopeptide (TPR) repeat protein